MPLNDTALLERWIARGDAEAFDEIVHRFADQVFGTARRILRNDAEAEDVTQECFLLLVRSGGEVRTSLGGWLHRAATSRSLDRIRSEARRRAREQAYSEATAQAAEATWDDIQGHVDAAINELPESTRNMIVAHFLGRKTHEEIAVERNMNRRAVSLRIQRGLESIRRDFARRGITLSAAALGPLLVDNLSAAAPLTLKASLGKLAIAAGTTGGAGTVATTSQTGSLLIMKMKLAASIFTVGIVAAGVYFVGSRQEHSAPLPDAEVPVEQALVVDAEAAPSATTEPGSTSAIAERSDESPEPLEALLARARALLDAGLNGRDVIDDPALFAAISGVALDGNGYPLEDATVTLIPLTGWSYLPGAEEMIVSTRSAADGSYRIEGISRTGKYWVNAAKPGYVNGARGTLPDSPVEVVPGLKADGIDFTLAPGVTLRGHVLDKNGQPVANAFVQGIAIMSPRTITMFNRNGALTDKHGAFALGFEEQYRGAVVGVRVQSPSQGSSTFPTVTIEDSEQAELRIADKAVIHGRILDAVGGAIGDTTFHFSARKSPAIEGGTMDALSGTFPAVTDAHGYYAVEVDSGLDLDVTLRAGNTDRPIRQEKIAALTPGELREFNFELNTNKKLTVSGRLIGTPSGNPIAPRGGCKIRIVKDEIWQLEEHGGAEFKLELALEPGAYQFQACYEFNERVSGPISQAYDLVADHDNQVEIVMPDPQYFSVRAVDGEGNPVEGTLVNIMTTTVDNVRTDEHTNVDGRLDGPIAMPPDCGARVWLEKPGYAPAWGAIHENQSPGTVHPEDVIVMHAGAGFEGELADAEGDPVADLELLITVTSASGQSWPLETRTDGEGHFTVVDRAPSEVVDIEIGIKPQAVPVEIRLGNDLVSLPGVEVKEPIEPTEPDLRVWRADQVALEPGAITDLGVLSLDKS